MADQSTPPRFKAGSNIALKLPARDFERTKTFYRDVLGLPLVQEERNSLAFEFGSLRLWLDRMEGLDRAQVWLEVRTDDTEAAAEFLAGQGVERRDEVEELPPGFDGFWISDPAGIIYLVSGEED